MEHYIQAFVNGSKEVFRDLCNTEIKAGRAFFVTKYEFEKSWDVSGIIGLSGEVKGVVAISFKESTALKLAKNLTGIEYIFIDNNVTDVIGEIANIITGNVKNIFEKKYRVKISIPSIFKGNSHAVIWSTTNTRIISIPFSIFENQEFCLSVAMEKGVME